MNEGLSDRIFQTSPGRQLLVVDRLSASERRLLGDQLEDPSLYGVLRPKGCGVTQAVDRDMALLLFTLQTPGPLPAFLRREMEPQALRRWTRGLLAAGVLEIEADGRFLAGEEAVGSLEDAQDGDASGTEADRASRAPSTLGRLSLAALESAAALPGAGRRSRSRWLYRYGRQPLTPPWRARLGSKEAVPAWLGLDGPVGARLDGAGRRFAEGGWISWTFEQQQNTGTGPTYKLYISPRIAYTAAALDALSQALGHLGAYHLKIGQDLPGLLRADKLMLYFADFDTLSSAAAKLQVLFADLKPQGVPFTADIGLGGLLSWGADPPRARNWSPDPTRSSWRQWITNRLAAAFDEVHVFAGVGSAGDEQAGPGPASAARQVIDLLALEGIDTDTWSPDPARWSGLENSL